MNLKKFLHYLLAVFPLFGTYWLFEKCPYQAGEKCRIWNCPAYDKKSKIYHLCPIVLAEQEKYEPLPSDEFCPVCDDRMYLVQADNQYYCMKCGYSFEVDTVPCVTADDFIRWENRKIEFCGDVEKDTKRWQDFLNRNTYVS